MDSPLHLLSSATLGASLTSLLSRSVTVLKEGECQGGDQVHSVLPGAHLGPAALRRGRSFPSAQSTPLPETEPGPGLPPVVGASLTLHPVMPSAGHFRRRDWGTLGRAVSCEPWGHTDGR